ncbi:MAG: hypothetical protein V1821_01245 [bacterium]
MSTSLMTSATVPMARTAQELMTPGELAIKSIGGLGLFAFLAAIECAILAGTWTIPAALAGYFLSEMHASFLKDHPSQNPGAGPGGIIFTAVMIAFTIRSATNSIEVTGLGATLLLQLFGHLEAMFKEPKR